jgi:hypothetical protein
MTRSLPILPLRDIVVFPHRIVPLFVGRGFGQLLARRQRIVGNARPGPGNRVVERASVRSRADLIVIVGHQR